MTIPPLEPRATGGLRLAGTRTFRRACGALFGRYGGNMQNPEKHTIDIHVARNGYKFVQPDQSGAEALVVAYLARPGAYRELFLCGIKPHTFLALHIFAESKKDKWPFRYPIEDYLNKSPRELAAMPGWAELDQAIKDSDADPDKPYYIGKRTAHGKSYCMGPHTFLTAVLKDSGGTMVLTFAQAKAFLTTFEILFPEVIEWQEEVKLTVQRYRELRNLFGFPRRFERIFTESYLREAVAFIPQSTVGIITANAITRAQLFIEANNRDWNVLNDKHDSMLLEVPDAEVNEAAIFARDCMAQKLLGRDNTEFTMGSEVQVGANWMPWHPEKNPAGMKKHKFV